MATIGNLKTAIGLQVRDTGFAEITAANVLALINQSARDAGNAGWLILISDDTSLTYAAITFAYEVPASFLHIKDVFDVNGLLAQRHYWDLRTQGGDPTIVFNDAAPLRLAAGALTIVGYKRPKEDYTADGDTVEAGIETFLTFRAASYALTYMVAGVSELDQVRQQQAELRMRDSEIALQRRIEIEERLVPTLRAVPGR